MVEAQHSWDQWQPWRPHEVAALFATLRTPWWIAGGWAIDLFLGRQTRAHEDIDVLILRRDRHALRAQLRTWDVQAALPEPRDESWPFLTWCLDEDLGETIHDIWCRPAATQPWALQLMIDNTLGDKWICRRTPSIQRSVATLGGLTPDGIPYLAPEIQLLYKAKGLRPKDAADFRSALPVLSSEQRAWLRAALLQAHPQHPWLERLTDG
jgi:hypothetical protein